MTLKSGLGSLKITGNQIIPFESLGTVSYSHGTRVRSIKWGHFEWPWMTLSYSAKYSMTRSIATSELWVLWRDTMQARLVKSCGVRLCVSVCPSVTFVDSVERNKHIFDNFWAHNSFSVPNVMAIFRREPLTGASNAGGVCRNHDSEQIYGSIACCGRHHQVQYTQPRRTIASWWH